MKYMNVCFLVLIKVDFTKLGLTLIKEDVPTTFIQSTVNTSLRFPKNL